QILRDNANPLEKYNNTELLQRYRFSRRTIQDIILPLIYPRIMENTDRGLPIPPLIKVCVALRFYATGSFQKTCGDLQTISQSSVCRLIAEVSEILARNIGQYVKFPATEEENVANRSLFFDMARFPGVTGDSAYPQLQYLFIPVQNPNTQAEQRYNSSQIKTRNVVERTFGMWKGRFRCLSISLNCKLRKTMRIIATTAVLHNIAIFEREHLIADPNFIRRIIPNPPAPN
ncbi:hypothetical protein CBL_20206, partial [Carabus blaptoides fortunei]